jgi:dolichyl-phosphate beta-glucosyltransferase
MTMQKISVIVPVYNGVSYIEKNILTLHRCLESCFNSFEIIVVDDGSVDNTLNVLQKLSVPVVLLHRKDNRGKGLTIKEGMLSASGDCRVFIDADLPFDLKAIPYAVDLIQKHAYHIVVGDRTLPKSIYNSGRTLVRRKASKLFSFFVRILVTGGLFDTQCGFKAFRGDIAKALFPLLTCRGFSFDVELLYIALKYNMVIRRIPVKFKSSSPSTISPLFTGIEMIKGIGSLRSNWNKGMYKNEYLEKTCGIDY